MNKYTHIFTDVLGTNNLVRHHINLTSTQSVHFHPHIVPYSVRESLKQEIKEMEDWGIIRKSKFAYASPVVIVRKRDGSNLCVDYRKLNKVTVFDPKPMIPANALEGIDVL